MAITNSKVFIPMFLAIFSPIFIADSVQGFGRLPTNEEYMDLDRQLKLINKPAIKSFQTKYGDIVDCIDIYKQLAFDHPLLKNHTIQMKPKTTPKELGSEASTDYKSKQYMPKNIKCPPGSVPIKRARREDLIMAKSMKNIKCSTGSVPIKRASREDLIMAKSIKNIKCPPASVPIKRAGREDLIMAKYIKSLGLNYPANNHLHDKNVDTRGHHSEVLEHTPGNFGARGHISIWNPCVNQFSCDSMWIVNGQGDKLTSIQTGWIVESSGQSRLYTYWTSDGYQSTGCFNTLCAGFAQVNADIALGLVLPHSIVSGTQFDALLTLYQFSLQIHRLLAKVGHPCARWWRKLCATGRTSLQPLDVLRPEMGSGNFPVDAFGVNHGRRAYVSQIQVVRADQESSKFDNPQLEGPKIWADKPVCYNALRFANDVPGWSFQVYFGGPGGLYFLEVAT